MPTKLQPLKILWYFVVYKLHKKIDFKEVIFRSFVLREHVRFATVRLGPLRITTTATGDALLNIFFL